MARGKGKGKAKGKQTHRNDTASTSNLAGDDGGNFIFTRKLLINILSRLPVKSLLRFKCASRQWRSIISSQSFISVHLTRSPLSLLIYAQKPPISDQVDYPNGHVILSYRHTPSTVNPIPDFPGFEDVGPDNQMDVIGSTPNGVVCIVQKPFAQKFTLWNWNPATRSCLSIPASGIDPIALYQASPGIGFDPARKEYILIRIVRYWDETQPDVAELFSFKTGRWSTTLDCVIKNDRVIPFAFRDESPTCTVVNGVPYWSAKRDSDMPILMWFDMKKSVFKSQYFPWDRKTRPMCLGEIREGYLGAIIRDDVKKELEVWVRISEEYRWILTYRVNETVGRVMGFYEDGIMREVGFHFRGIADEIMQEVGFLCRTTLGDVADQDFVSIPGAWLGTCDVLNYRESLTRMPTIRFAMIE
ncbi:hypothetical protein CASFOL_039303 [Castilleja foliolosa]|uniref:F-box domain-containing protein n=1 Tax=Castilleja foliolosa TaxID=1961234 RepID=A0ABD3BI89_9LAMI